MEQPTEIVETGTQSKVGTETPSKVETATQLSQEEIAELLELKKSKTHFQSVADSKIAEANKIAMEEKVRREMLEAELNNFKNPKPVVQPLIEPVEPQQPSDYDPIDGLTKGTSSYAYEQQYKKYLRDTAIFNKELVKRERQELEEKLKSFNELAENEKKKSEQQQFENMFIAGLQQEGGLDESTARKAFKFFTSKESADFKTLGQLWKAMEGTPTKPVYQAPVAPTGSGGAQVNTSEYTKNADKSWMYKTKK